MRVQISVVDANNQTQISAADLVKGQPALKHVAKAGQRITLTLDGVVLTGAQVVENKKIQLVKVGKNLVVETIDGEEKYIEIIDFYSEQGVELTGEAWSYSDESQLIKLDGGVTADGSELLDGAWRSGAVVGLGGAGLGMGAGGLATVGMFAGLAINASEQSAKENNENASKVPNTIIQPVWSVETTTASVDEGAGFIIYTVSRTGSLVAATIDFATAGGSATGGADYTALNQTLSFAEGEASKTMRVAITDDALPEGNETVTASIANASVGTIAVNSVTSKILDNEQPVWSVETTTTLVDEDAGFITYTVSRTGLLVAATIDFATAGGSATGGADYTAVIQTLSFAAGQTSKTMQVAITDDALPEGNETVTASIANASVGTIEVNSATSMILDNEQPVWSVETTTTLVDEGAGFITYTVSRTGTRQAATIDFVTSGGTATGGADYTTVNQTLSFAAGQTSRTIQVAIRDDAVAEGNETVGASITNASVGTIAVPSVTSTILDNEPPVWSVASTTSSVDEGAGFITYTVSRTGTSVAASIDFSTAGGTASRGLDYTALSQTLNFAVGETSKTVQVAITDDVLPEGNETVTASIANASAGTMAINSATSTILDNEQSVWSIDAPTSVVDEGAGFITYVVSRTGASPAASINVATGGGSASSGSDYTALNQILNFAAGEMSKTVQVAITDDALPEANETITTAISNASTGTISKNSVTATINDNEQSVWSIDAATSVVDEGASFISYVVSRTGASAAASINVATAGGSATSGIDYTALNQALSFAAGEMSKTVLVAISDDALPENNETIIAAISNASGGTIARNSATATVNDNDQSVWSIDVATPVVDEGSGFITFVVSRTGASAAASINVATGGGSATGGSDYTALNQTLSFAAGETSKTVQVAVNDDALPETNETMITSISNASSGTIAKNAATATINDNEQSVWSIDSTMSAVDEGSGFITFVVSRTGASAAASINVATGGGSATGGSDYTALNQTLSFAAGEMSKTVQVAITDDALPETNETITTAISNASTGTIAKNAATVTVNDNEQPIWSIGVDTPVVDEGSGFITYVVSRTGAGPAASIDVATSGGTASSASDYTALNQTLNFAVGEMSKTVQVAVNDDPFAENNETIITSIGNASAGTIASTTAMATVNDNDQSLWSLTVAENPMTEGSGFMVFTITRVGGYNIASIDFGITTALIVGKDYVDASQTLNFALGEMSKTVKVQLVDDALLEPIRNFAGVISNTTSGTIVPSAASVIVPIFDDELPNWLIQAETPVVDEGSGFASFTVYRLGSTEAATINFSTENATAIGAADFTGQANRVLSFAAGEMSKTVQVAITEDGLAETIETFNGRISNASGIGIIRTATATVSINDNDQSVWNVAVATPEVDEGAGYITFTVSRIGAAGAASIDFFTSGGSATKDLDYAASNQTLSFAAGEMSKTVRVLITDDTLAEQNETIFGGIGNASTGTVGVASTTATVNDNDQSSWRVATIASPIESDGTLAVTVSRTGTLNAATIDFRAGGAGSATPSVDFVDPSQTLSFAQGEVVKTVLVKLINDTASEGAEGTQFTILNASSGSIAQNTSAATIQDDDLITYTADVIQATVSEDAGFINFRIARGVFGAMPEATVTFEVFSGSATAGVDYTPFNRQVVTFAAGELTKIIQVAIVDDNVAEANETVVARVSDLSAGNLGSVGTMTATILDNDQVSLAVTALQSTAREEAGTMSFLVTRSGNVQAQGAVNWSVTGGTGQLADLTGPLSGVVNFAAGELTQIIIVGILDDALTEVDETFVINCSVSSAWSNGSVPTIVTGSATASIVDNDETRFAITAGANDNENAGVATFTVTRSGNLQTAGSVDWMRSGGTATLADFVGSTSGTVSFAAGESSKTIAVGLNNDAVAEATETFAVVLSNAQSSAGSTAIAGASVSKNIIDDDRVTWVITASAAPENAGFSTFKVTRTGDLLQTATISYGSTGRAGASATPGLDYTPVTGNLTFAPGVAEQYINVPLINDNVAEGSDLLSTAEQIVVGISDPSIGVVVASSASSGVSDDDGIEYTLANGVTVDESAGVMYFSIFRSGNRSVETTVDYSTTGKASSIASPSITNAIAGKDYTPVSGTLTFAVGETYKTVAVAITDDLLGENTEDVIFAIGNASRGNIPIAQIGNFISDNDRMQWSISGGATLDEGAGQMFFTVTRSGNLQQAASIDYNTTGQGSSNSSAIPGKDYTSAFGTLNFAVGESSKTVAVAITDDTRGEASEAVLMGLSNASQGTITTSNANNTITDNDLVVWSVTALVLPLAAAEGDKMMYTVSRTGNWQQAATIDYSTVSGVGTLLAQPGSDFTPTSGTLSFAAGERIKTILVDVSVDSALEPSEQIGLILANASVGSFVNTAATTSSGTIQADVSAGVTSFALAAVEASAWEGAGYAYFTITRSGEVTGTQTINFRTTSGGTATSGTDFSAVPFTTYTFNPGETLKVVAVTITNDPLVEANETIEAQIGGASTGNIAIATTTITIQDDEANAAGIYGNQTPSAFVLSASQANNWEGAGYAFFTITRTNDASLTSTVDFATNTVGTATAGSDFTAVATTTYTFAPGETVKFVKVAITSDAVAEGNETIQAVLSNATNATITTATISTIILDDDGGLSGFDGNPTTPQFVLSAVQNNVWEGAG